MATVRKADWFPEPAVHDRTYAQRRVQPFDWNAQSTTMRASAARAFLNRNLSELPEDAQPHVVQGLKVRWGPTFFELIVARTLQLLGASLTVEPEGPEGKRVDFVAAFGAESVNVEATSPNVDAEFGEQASHQRPLVDIVESSLPDGWSAGVVSLPVIGPNDPKRWFRNAVASLMATVRSDDGEPVDIQEEFAEGLLHLRLFPKTFGGHRIAYGPGGAYFVATVDHIRRSVGRKKRQARSPERPSLLAVHTGGLSSELDDFDQALFGHTVGYVDRRLGEVAQRFEPDGTFAAQR